MRIAIIDKYISEKEVFSLTGKNVHPIAITGNGDECGKLIDNAPLLSHGTVCAALLTEFVLDSDYIAISVAPNKNDDFVVQNICYALSWCLNNPTDYICISAGTTNWRASQPMKSLTKRLSESGTKIVAAVSPDSALTFPACYPCLLVSVYKRSERSHCQLVRACAGSFRSRLFPAGDKGGRVSLDILPVVSYFVFCQTTL